MLKHLLEQAGHQVNIFENGEQLLQELDRACAQQSGRITACYDVIILDFLMPGMNSIETARRIREREQNWQSKTADENLSPPLPIILATADSRTETHTAAQEAGVITKLIKPFSSDALSRLLQKHCG